MDATVPAEPPFPGAETDLDFESADAVLFGAPHGTPYPGEGNAHQGGTADALRRAYAADSDVPGESWSEHWDFDFDGTQMGPGGVGEHGFRLLDAGNLTTTPTDGAGNRERIRALTGRIVAAGAVPIMIGGDDSVPIPFFEALAPLGPLTVVQIDAHIDWRDERFGEPLGYSSTMRRASEMGHIERIVQVGIRGRGSARRAEVEIARDWGARIVTARDLHRDGIDAVRAHLPAGGACVITLDCDGLDPSVLPAVGAPAPGGLTYTQAVEVIAAVAKTARIAAFDLVEFVPGRDPDGLSARVAARLVTNVIGQLANNANPR